MSASKILVILTGSIAAYKACDAISKLRQRGHELRCVATPSALRFVGVATLEGLTGQPVHTDTFAAGGALEHIDLTRWADLVLVCPATANTLNRFAAGLGDDLAGALFLGHDRRKPWLIAPAMNPEMWSHPATVASVEKLRDWGVRFIPVGEGRTACGERGEGRLAEPETVVATVEQSLRHATQRKTILVTSGGTAEPIDGVRVLTNTSTGATGAAIATHLARAGHDVVLLRAHQAIAADGPCAEETFGSFAELSDALQHQLGTGRFHAVIHAAAVSDYGVEAIIDSGGEVPPGAGQKIVSGRSPLLRLRPYPKLVDRLRGWSPSPLLIVAFKLTAGASPDEAVAAVRDLLAHSGADFVVHNDTASREADGTFPADIFDADALVRRHCRSRAVLSQALEELVAGAALSGEGRPCS